MGHTGRFDQRLALAIVQALEARIAIGLQDAAEVFQVLARPLAFTIGRVAKKHGGRIGAAGGLIIPNVRP